MPVLQRDKKWYWGSKGPFDSRKKAEKVAQAAHASGYVAKFIAFTKAEEGIKGIKGIGDLIRTDPQWGGRPKDDVPKEFREYATPEEIKRLGLRPQTGVDEGTFYDTRDLEAGQYAAATGDKHTIDELREAGNEGEITLDDLGIEIEDTPFDFSRHDSPAKKVDLNRKNSIGQTHIDSTETDLLGTAEAHYNYSSGKARKWASSIERDRNPVGGGELDSSKHKYVWDWMERAGDTEDEYAGTIRKEFERLLGRGVGNRELMSDLAPELRQSAERRIVKAQKELKQLDKLKNEIEAFKIQRGVDRIGLKRKVDPTTSKTMPRITRDEAQKAIKFRASEIGVDDPQDQLKYILENTADDDVVTVFHGTTKEGAEKIRRTGRIQGDMGGGITFRFESASGFGRRAAGPKQPRVVLQFDIPKELMADFTPEIGGHGTDEFLYDPSGAAALAGRKIPEKTVRSFNFDPKSLKHVTGYPDSIAEQEGNEVEKLLDFIKAEGDLEGIKPIEGLGSQDSEREDYEGKEITTRKYIQDPEDAPEVNGEKVKVYLGPERGHFYDYSQLDATEHVDEFTKIVDEAYDALEEALNEKEGTAADALKLGTLTEISPWEPIRLLSDKVGAANTAILKSVTEVLIEKYPNGEWLEESQDGSKRPKLSYMAEVERIRSQVMEDNPELGKNHLTAFNARSEGIRDLLRGESLNRYGETEGIEKHRRRIESLQTDVVRAIIHSLHGKMTYHNGEESLSSNKEVEIRSAGEVHEYALKDLERRLSVEEQDYWNRRGLEDGWTTFIGTNTKGLNTASLHDLFGRYINIRAGVLGYYEHDTKRITISSDMISRSISKNIGDYNEHFYSIPSRDRQHIKTVIAHELVHSGHSETEREALWDIKDKKAFWKYTRGTPRRTVLHVSKSIREKYLPDIRTDRAGRRRQAGVVIYNNQKFFEEFPVEILSQRIIAEQLDLKDADGEDGSFAKGGHSGRSVGYAGSGIEQFSVWVLKFAEKHELKMAGFPEAKTPEGKAKIAHTARLLCKELLNWEDMKAARRAELSGSFAMYARKHDTVHGLTDQYKNEEAYHVGVNPNPNDLLRYKIERGTLDADGFPVDAKIPNLTAKKSDEFGSGMDKKALRRIILG